MKTRLKIFQARDVDPRSPVFVPADKVANEDCREAGLSMGQTVMADIRRARNPKFHRLAFAFARMIRETVDKFQADDSRKVLKRLQLIADAGCEELMIELEGYEVPYRIPKSLSYESMSEDEFQRVIGKIADYCARHYFSEETTAEDLVRMADELARGIHDA